MKYTYMIYPLKFFISLGTSVVSSVLAVSMLIIARLGSFLLFFVIAVIFLIIAFMNGSQILIDENGISHMLFHKTLHHYSWKEIYEVGVIGSKVFRNDNKKNVGSRYLYFSPKIMSDNERFQMLLKWPPHNKLYMLYTPERLAAVQHYWSNSIISYNAGDIFF